MNIALITSQLLSENLFIHPSALSSYRSVIKQLMAGNIRIEEKEALKMAFYNSAINEAAIDQNGDLQEKSVAVINVIGPIVKFGNWFYWGADEYEWMLDQAYADENISAIILRFHTPGGMVHAMNTMSEAIQKRNKPIIGVIDSMCYSAGVYSMVFCDEIIATNPKICQTGSIGVISTILDDRKMMEEYGLKEIITIPPESKDKMDTYFKARDGEPDLLIKYELSPLAVHFQDVVKKNRPKLKTETKRLLTGGEFFADEALEAGLIDQIMPFTEIIEYAHAYAGRNEFANSI